MKPEQFLASLEPYTSYENNAELRHGGADLMNALGILEHFQLADGSGHVPIGKCRLRNSRKGCSLTLMRKR